MFNLPAAPSSGPLPRLHPLHPPHSVCPIFLLLVFEPSSSAPRLSLLYLSSHYFCFVPFFSQLIFGVSRSTFLTTLAEFSLSPITTPQIRRPTLVHLLWCVLCVLTTLRLTGVKGFGTGRS